MKPNNSISEVLEKASKLSNKKEKIEYLRKNASSTLTSILQGAYDPAIKWLLPSGDTPYKPYEGFDAESMLHMECRKFYLYVEGGHPTLKQTKREMLWIGLLESIMPKDAILMNAVKDKKLPYKGLDRKIILEAFPGLWTEPEKPKKEKSDVQDSTQPAPAGA